MKGLRLFTVIICCLVFQQLLNAQTTYTSVLSGEWSNAAVWSPPGVPGAGDIVNIAQGTIVSTNGQREVAGFNTLAGAELLLSGNDGSLTITGNANWGGAPGGGVFTDGTSNNNGVVLIASGAVVDITGNSYAVGLTDGVTVLNQGTIRMSTDFGVFATESSVIENQALFEIDTEAGYFTGIINGGTFINTSTGILRKISGMSACIFNANWNFQNLNGNIDVQTGSIVFSCDGLFSGGTYNADAGALLHFDSQNHTFEGTLSGAPAGTIEISAGVTANTGTTGVTFDFQGTGFNLSGGIFTGSMITIPSTGLLVLNRIDLYGGTTLLNLGTIRQEENNGISALDSSIVDNQSLYEIDTEHGSLTGSGDGGIFINSGVFRKVSGTGVALIRPIWHFQNQAGGVIDAASGEMDFGNLDNAPGAIIQGVATIDVHTVFTNDGITAPGNSPGTLTYIGNFLPSATGVLDIELGGLTPGSGHDQLAVTGNAVLNGTIEVSVTGSFIPAPGDSFVVLTTTGTVSDSFMTVSAQSGLYVDVQINSNNVTIHIDSVGVLSVEEISNGEIVTNYELQQNYPNPFNPSTNIQFSVPQSSYVTLEVYNLVGERVVVLVSEQLGAGTYNYDWNATNLTSGIYFYRIQAGNFVETKKMMLLK